MSGVKCWEFVVLSPYKELDGLWTNGF